MSAESGDNELKVTIFDDGPVEIHGPVTILDEKGNTVATMGAGETAYLCRCGSSNDKPFCDGTHDLARFKSSMKERQAQGK